MSRQPRKPRARSQGAAAPGFFPAREMRLAFAVIALVVAAMALAPGAAAAPRLLGWDKVEHAAAFAAMALFARAGWPGLSRAWTAGLLIAYGVLIEIAQGLPVIGRSASVADVAADAFGVALGLLAAWMLGRAARIVRR